MKLINLVLVLIIYSNLAFPQVIDSSSAIFPDTVLTSQTDTSFISSKLKKKSYDVDTVIYTVASDSLIFFVKDKKMKIYGEGSLNYKETNLKAANIFVDFESSNLEAVGIPFGLTF